MLKINSKDQQAHPNESAIECFPNAVIAFFISCTVQHSDDDFKNETKRKQLINATTSLLALSWV